MIGSIVILGLMLLVAYYALLVWKWDCIPSSLVPASSRPPILNERHDDFDVPFLKWIPRKFTTLLSDKEPKKLCGTAPIESHFDITPLGTWVITFPFFISIRLKNGWYFRFGDRYDYNDHYYEIFAIALKRIR